ncbi:hypothetical protein IQ264_13145 [Phormidium sp. LEGE 05292]|uniref:hypothetical protein n=1 Tax=[Phormidium] sp. LEGE 05292 TaxID=767427 RepID=UPI001881F874|nr:hypothetical protein [Phormidium sp. LEGE 05292]MBE9226369.1 hypothetical protein [Phormidium sp. LEGE 05292]
MFALKLFSAIGCGLIAGVFFAFSTFVMNALSRLGPLKDWTFWNHIRTVAALVAAVLLTFALCDRSLKL